MVKLVRLVMNNNTCSNIEQVEIQELKTVILIRFERKIKPFVIKGENKKFDKHLFISQGDRGLIKAFFKLCIVKAGKVMIIKISGAK
jgi:hypothetical protein